MPQYVESVGLYGTSLCIGLQRLEYRLNQLQADWARSLLGCSGLPQGSWFCLIAECGWTTRLGSKVLLAAIMLEAQIDTLQQDLVARRMLTYLRRSPHASWASQVAALRSRLGNLPTIRHWFQASEEYIFDSGKNIVIESCKNIAQQSYCLQYKDTMEQRLSQPWRICNGRTSHTSRN